MDLQTVAVIVAVASPLLVTGAAWGTYHARLAMIERRVDGLEQREREAAQLDRRRALVRG